MTPTIYESVGNRLSPAKNTLWIAAVTSIVFVVSAVFLLRQSDSSLLRFGALGFSLFALILAWGLLLSVYWFSSNRVLSTETISGLSGTKRTIQVVFSWYAAALLTLWFVSGFVFVPVMLLRKMSNA